MTTTTPIRTRVLSHTELQTLTECFARWDLTYSDALAGSSLQPKVTANAFQAYQLALIALRNDRRVPDDVVEAVRQKLGAVVYGVHYGLMQEAS
jgi:hypothetical protein